MGKMNKTVKRILQAICFLAVVCFLAGCYPGAKEKVPVPLKKLKPDRYPMFTDDMEFENLAESMEQSLTYFRRVPTDRIYTYGKETYTAAHMIASMETFKAFLETKPSAHDLNEFIRSYFFVYAAAGNSDGEVLFTGYFEPTYEGSLEGNREGSLEPGDAYPYPLYSRPNDLVEIDLSLFSDKYKGHRRLTAMVNPETKRVVPYDSRQKINAEKDFHTRSEPVAWLKNRVDRFFLEIQGSGRIDLGNGEVLRVHYAGSNGKAYRSIGRYLIDKNEILKENMSMQAIRTWLEMHPDRMDEVLHFNESFVFFRTETGGPYGSIGVEVTPLRSIATDRRLFPKGGLCFVQTRLPDTININPLKEWQDVSFFVLNQDTGGAINGPARADLFCGNGHYAKFTAGHMNQYGRLFFLVMRPEKT